VVVDGFSADGFPGCRAGVVEAVVERFAGVVEAPEAEWHGALGQSPAEMRRYSGIRMVTSMSSSNDCYFLDGASFE
jgi:hypothetical protein